MRDGLKNEKTFDLRSFTCVINPKEKSKKVLGRKRRAPKSGMKKGPISSKKLPEKESDENGKRGKLKRGSRDE